MAYNPLYKMSIQSATGDYLTADLNQDASWTVTPNPTLTYIEVLPDGWADTAITWERDMSYMGIFRSQTNSPYKFSMDGRAIIQSIRNAQGIQGYGLLTIYIFNPVTFAYDIYYQSELDFKTYHDTAMTEMCEISTLDSKAVRDLHARGDSKVNVPIWKNTGTPSSPVWVLNGTEFIWHDGIKLLYNATYTSSASKTNPLIFNNGSGAIGGFNRGRHGTGSAQGFHTIINMSQYNITQNNGTTTFIGNDILQPFLIQGNQTNSANGTEPGEEKFDGTNNSQPYTRSNNSLKNLLPSPSGTIDLFANISGAILGGPNYPFPTIGTQILTTGSPPNPFIGYVLFEIGPTDVCTPDPITGEYSYIPIYRQPILPLLALATDTVFSVTVPITIKLDRVYLFDLIFDDLGSPLGPGNAIQTIGFSNLQYSILSQYNSGTAAPVDAPMFPPSPAAGFRILPLLQKLVSYLPSINSDGYGFPVPVASDFTLTSNFLDNPATNPLAPSAPIADVIPWDIIMTSAYCLHDLSGQSYLTTSFNEQFDFFHKQLGGGLGLIGDSFVMENLRFFFNANVMILDLGYTVTELEVFQDTVLIGANLKAGYTKAETNSDFGVDALNTNQYYDTPATNIPSVMDFEEDSILTEQYAIEKIRAQQTSQPIGQSYVEDPSTPVTGFGQTVNCFRPVKYSNAQSTDPAATIAPYVQGAYYPDTYINIPFSPARALYRDTGALIHSCLDKMDSQDLIFRSTYVMQYNNTTLALTGFATNLEVGAGGSPLVEFGDKNIGVLPAKLFLPVKVVVKATSDRSLYTQMNTNPNGYCRFFFRNEGYGFTEYRIFMNKIQQIATANGNVESEITGWGCPSGGGYISPF